MKKFLKRKHKSNIIEDLSNIQKLIFAPLAFQSINSMIELGILEFLDKNSSTITEIMTGLNLDEYIVSTLLEVGEANNLLEKKDKKYSLTNSAKLFLYDDMTRVNFNYVKDVCYLGASELTSSFTNKSPMGLKKFIKDSPTIYPLLSTLPEKIKNSWYEFDHMYSDNCFDKVITIILQNHKKIVDIGGNTGKFEKICLNNGVDITMVDLPENIENIKDKEILKNCKFHKMNVLEKNPLYPELKDCAILMSQFLDCFSKKDIIKILKDISNRINENSSIFILEPFTDMQNFEASKYALVHSSLYFTCIANGVSKFYTLEEMKEMIHQSGLVISQTINDIGAYSYTLLECKKNAMVSD